jgi:hypothetical protein
MREAKIWKKFKSINEKVRDEMKRAQEQYKKTNKKDMKFLDCYDAWLNYQLGDFVNNGKNWVKDAIDEVKREKKPAESKENDPDGHKFYDALTTVLDILQQEADVAIQSSHFSLAKDDGDAMDTSD